jgi:two-component system chemotaxis sensor kinase CheA
MHLVRNAVDHGLESPEARAAAGKPRAGKVTLKAWSEAGRVVVEVADDGRGLDKAAIARKAREKGLWAGSAEPSDAELHALICRPGFSTRDEASTVSGRGVGLDVVRGAVERLRGTLRIDSRPGHGTRFTIRLPLTLALIDGFSVQVGEQTYVVPLDAVVECVELPKAQRLSPAVKGLLDLRGEALPWLRLHGRLDVRRAEDRESVVVVKTSQGHAGLVVDALKGTAQVTVKPIPPHVDQSPGVAGATVLGDGKVALILDIEALLLPELTDATPGAAPVSVSPETLPAAPHEEVTP